MDERESKDGADRLRLFEAQFARTRAARGLELVFVPLPELLPGGGVAEATLASLAPSERAEFARLRVAKRRRDWLGGRLAAKAAVRRLVARWWGQDLAAAEIEIGRNAAGAPEVHLRRALVDGLDIAITLCHAGDLAAAVAFRFAHAGAIGLDLEPLMPVDIALRPLAFTAREEAAIQAAPDESSRRFLDLGVWTAKEAVLKAIGLGFAVPFHDVEITPRGVGEHWHAVVAAGAGSSAGRELIVEVALVADHVVALAHDPALGAGGA